MSSIMSAPELAEQEHAKFEAPPIMSAPVIDSNLNPIVEGYRPKLAEAFGEKVRIIYRYSGGPDKYGAGYYEIFPESNKYWLSNGGSMFTIKQMPGCCGICISTGCWIHHNSRNKGIGTLLNKLRIDLARGLGYGILMCTDVTSNQHQRRILSKNGWKDIYTFVNPRTNHEVAISVIDLVVRG